MSRALFNGYVSSWRRSLLIVQFYAYSGKKGKWIQFGGVFKLRRYPALFFFLKIRPFSSFSFFQVSHTFSLSSLFLSDLNYLLLFVVFFLLLLPVLPLCLPCTLLQEWQITNPCPSPPTTMTIQQQPPLDSRTTEITILAKGNNECQQ
jgi:hypothetical protein